MNWLNVDSFSGVATTRTEVMPLEALIMAIVYAVRSVENDGVFSVSSIDASAASRSLKSTVTGPKGVIAEFSATEICGRTVTLYRTAKGYDSFKSSFLMALIAQQPLELDDEDILDASGSDEEQILVEIDLGDDEDDVHTRPTWRPAAPEPVYHMTGFVAPQHQ